MSGEKYEPKHLISIDKRCLWTGLILMVSCFICWHYAWQGALLPESEKLSVWFQRSGSLTLVFCILAEIFLLKNLALASKIIALNPAIDTNFSKLWFSSISNFSELLIHALTVTSTLIWGYGDVIHKCLS